MRRKTKHLPDYIVEEFKELEKNTKPLYRKIRKYSLISFIAISLALFNILGLILSVDFNTLYFIPLTFFSVVGAFGMALQKEVKFLWSEIQKSSVRHIKERIEKTEFVYESSRKKYIDSVTNDPLYSMNIFAEFLEEENRQKVSKFKSHETIQ
ncbi:DUF5392 family protein [Halobacillus sp. BBL2006]|uniref:DUF5392 family protein n=1 Tax=Halobacillus sp. BBL2006 TaxID=1543706 RepID=UPI00054345EB|nr:DUF5392 family protein [Halobacillus sp. BBL2006]KHE68638.1 hypothetical protein LD39_14230 [Halobacillus sp. BBL2006]